MDKNSAEKINVYDSLSALPTNTNINF